MKPVILAALIALSGCVAGAPGTAPPTETTSVGAPTSLAPPGGSTVASPAPSAASYPSGRTSYATPAMTIDNAYHPSWTIHVYGFQ